jgi:hypothetical protein
MNPHTFRRADGHQTPGGATVVTVKLDADQLARLNAAAQREGGKSAVLHRLIATLPAVE